MTTQFHIAIDGPAGAGKSTVARQVAQRLNLTYVDTGAMYRVITFCAISKQINRNDEDLLVDLAKRLEFTFGAKGNLIFLVDGEAVTEAIRLPEVSRQVSYIARQAGVRQTLVQLQQEIARQVPTGVVMDGRDIGTFVLPDANIKIFLTASDEMRALRRFEDLLKAGVHITLQQVKDEIKQRDQIDSERSIAPLLKADDAVYLDSTDCTIEEVVNKIVMLVSEKKAGGQSDVL